jgi:integrase/recombinase XerD
MNNEPRPTPIVKFEIGQHNQQDVIFIKFAINEDLIRRVKKLPGATFTRTHSCWWVPDNCAYRDRFSLPKKDKYIDVPEGISENNTIAWKKYIHLLQQKAYSQNTLKTYSVEFSIFLKTLQQHDAESLETHRVNDYIHWCINTKKLSENQVHSRINAIKFYYEQVLGKDKIHFKITRPKKEKSLPKALSFEDVQAILNQVKNNKHYFILAITYGTGIRLSEIVNIKLCDIDVNRKTIFINRAKGKKDRIVNFPDSLLAFYKMYLLEFKPIEYLFEGQYGGKYSSRSVQLIYTEAKEKAKVLTPGGIHGLRHSYATHLHELGTDITLIQKLLGHNDLKTTMIYTQISKKEIAQVSSPLDRLIRGR